MPIWLQVLGFAIVVVTFLGSAAVFLRGSADKGTIDTLEKSNHALTERVGILEKSDVELRAKVSALERENVDLRSQRPSAEVLSEIRQDLSAYIGAQRDNNGETRALLMAIAQILGDKDAG